jgi:thiamine-phosphate pyrophosphorylase
MFVLKNNYYLYIDNTKIFDLSLIKKRNKFTIIYRNLGKLETLDIIKKFRAMCKRKGVKFFIANNAFLAIKCKADGLYLSSYNNCHYNNFSKLEIIGSAHNNRQINHKIRQRCNKIVFSRLFETNYTDKLGHLGIVKFNLLTKDIKLPTIALGGIRKKNLNKLKLVCSNSFAILSELKNNRANIIKKLL